MKRFTPAAELLRTASQICRRHGETEVDLILRAVRILGPSTGRAIAEAIGVRPDGMTGELHRLAGLGRLVRVLTPGAGWHGRQSYVYSLPDEKGAP